MQNRKMQNLGIMEAITIFMKILKTVIVTFLWSSGDSETKNVLTSLRRHK